MTLFAWRSSPESGLRPMRLNEEALSDAKAIAEEEFITTNDIDETEGGDAPE